MSKNTQQVKRAQKKTGGQKPVRRVSYRPRTCKIALPYSQAHAVYIQIDFCKVSIERRYERKQGFDSYVKWPFLAPRRGHISSYSCPCALVPSRIDSPKRSPQNISSKQGFRVSDTCCNRKPLKMTGVKKKNGCRPLPLH